MAFAAAPTVDAAALQAWRGLVDSRMDAADHAIAEGRAQLTGTNVALATTIEQAKAALGAIVDGVRVEMVGIQSHFRADGDLRMAQLTSVVNATQQKFAQIEGSLTQVVSGLEARLAGVELRAARGEQRVDQLVASAPLGTPASTPPPSPRRKARFDPWQDAAAATSPWACGGRREREREK